MLVRREQATDHAEVRAVHTAAFSNGDEEPAEVRLLDALRESGDWLPHLSWVVEFEGRVVGHCVCTRGHVGDVACVGLGPVGVHPTMQRTGVGSALMHAMIGAADAGGEPLIALLGEPAYYSRFGFVVSTDLGVDPPEPEWDVHFQALPLSSWSDEIAGTFRYAGPFEEMS